MRDAVREMMQDGKVRSLTAVMTDLKRSGVIKGAINKQSVNAEVVRLAAQGSLSRLCKGVYQCVKSNGVDRH